MNKKFTKEDILKKHETNIKSATSSFTLAGILGIIYIVRYILKDNFNFYFSLSFSELILRLSASDIIPGLVAYIIIAVYLAIFIGIVILTVKSASNLKFSLGFYIFDCLCLIPLGIFLGEEFTSDFFIDVIVHLFVILFLIVGIRSLKKKG